ncbi:MAG TPA: ClpXP protease specificity-enhancing factor SspB [Methylocella sp.]|nr:ClpXP protease specificity-enhancing factor SspB [Methylocella sp.]
MAVDLIRYDLLVQDALRGVVREVLADAARDGLPGDHHFYITFRTHARGVRLSNRMRDRYPDEMTIVLQHQFWDLSVTGEAFEVGLSFQNVPEMLLIPFESVVRFADPAAGFELQFAPAEELSGIETNGRAASGPVPEPSSQLPLFAEPKDAKSEEIESAPAGEPAPEEAGPKVVSLENFRRKN